MVDIDTHRVGYTLDTCMSYTHYGNWFISIHAIYFFMLFFQLVWGYFFHLLDNFVKKKKIGVLSIGLATHGGEVACEASSLLYFIYKYPIFLLFELEKHEYTLAFFETRSFQNHKLFINYRLLIHWMYVLC